jgi:hypothetical protein
MVKRVILCFALVGCSEPRVPAMHPANGAQVPPPPAPGDASVVFVRPPSSCDSIDYPRIVDENGHFVGNAGSNTTFVVTVPAGRHAFYALPSSFLRITAHSPVSALLVDATEGGVAHVAIVRRKGSSLRCNVLPAYELVAHDDTDAARAEFESWTREATPMQPEREAGERDLRRDSDFVCAYVEAGRQRLAVTPQTSCGASAPVGVEAR